MLGLSQCEALANAVLALRWAAAGMMEASKGFRRLKAYKHLPVLRAGSSLKPPSISSQMELKQTPVPHSMLHGNTCLPNSTKSLDIALECTRY